MSHSATDIINLRRQLIDWLEGRHGVPWLQSFMWDVMKMRGADGYVSMFPTPPSLERALATARRDMQKTQVKVHKDEIDVEARKFALWLQFDLLQSDLFSVTSDMLELVKFAADSIPDTPIEHHHLPAEHGFLIMDDVNVVKDRVGRDVAEIGYHWAARGGGVDITVFTDRDSKFDEDMVKVASVVPADELIRLMPRLVLIHRFRIPFGKLPSELTDLDAEYEFAQRPIDAVRFIQAMWSIMQEPYVDIYNSSVPRSVRRQEERRFKHTPPQVRIVRLRRKESVQRDRDFKGVLQHRFFVKGHWHKFRVGPGRQMLDVKWVNTYMKGPEDAPLLLGEKVYRLER